jgi:hypothetical protein
LQDQLGGGLVTGVEVDARRRLRHHEATLKAVPEDAQAERACARARVDHHRPEDPAFLRRGHRKRRGRVSHALVVEDLQHDLVRRGRAACVAHGEQDAGRHVPSTAREDQRCEHDPTKARPHGE